MMPAFGEEVEKALTNFGPVTEIPYVEWDLNLICSGGGLNEIGEQLDPKG